MISAIGVLQYDRRNADVLSLKGGMDKNGNSLELIVRVKRKRENESSESICIIGSQSDDYQPSSKTKKKLKAYESLITNGISNLQTQSHSQHHHSHDDNSIQESNGNDNSNLPPSKNKKLILKKIQTVNMHDPLVSTTSDNISSNQPISNHFLSSLPPPPPISNPFGPARSRQYIFTSSTKISNNKSNIFMVDLAHISSCTTNSNSFSSFPVKKSNGMKILDPATRLLHAAFDINDPSQMIEQIINAIDQGANINYQRPSDGLTALMIAAQCSHVRLVSKLLQKGANVYLQNQDAKSAIDFADYADIENRTDASKQVSFLLRHAASSQYSSTFQPPAVPISENQSDDYVYDIYSLGQKSEEGINEEQVELGEDSMEIPTVEVPGIKIIDGDLSGEVTFCYDSDWSDLADDEDPDSNDEKFFGNDYPDEDWGDEDDEGGGCYNEKNDSDYNNIDSDEDDELGQRKVRWKPEIDDEEDDDGDDRMPKFDRKGIGRVLQPFIIHGPNGTSSNEKIDVNALWNLRPDVPNEDEQDESHQTRKEDMARRTGMMIGSSEREFDRNGLPKYGMELSDDDHADWIHSGVSDKRLYNHEAYDSDLDRSSSSKY